MATAFENFVNTELPKRIATNESPTTPQAGDIPIYTGVGLLTESKTASEAGLATETFATDAADTAETNAKSYADGLVTSIYKFQTTYDPQVTGQFPTTANTVGGVAIKKGFTWVISGVTGQYTFQGVTVDNGDTLLALVDNASATSAADWHITEKNLGYTPENSSNKYSDNDLAGGAGTYPATPSVKAYVDNGLSGKQNTLADVITANTYGSSTEWPKVTVNAKGIVTGVTLQTVPTPTFTDANFSVQKAGSPSIAASWDLTALTASVVHTYPNKAINFGDLPSVATTNSNNTSTDARLLKGDNCTLVNNSPCVVNGSRIASNFVTGGAGFVRGGAAGSASRHLRPTYVNVPLAVYTPTGATSSAWAIDGGTTYPMAVAPQENAGTYYLAIHRVTFSVIISGAVDAYVWTGVRRIVCKRDSISGDITIVSVTTEGTDYVQSGITGQSIGVTLGAVVTPSVTTTHAPLLITATSTTSGASSILCQATLESYYANIG